MRTEPELFASSGWNSVDFSAAGLAGSLAGASAAAPSAAATNRAKAAIVAVVDFMVFPSKGR